MLVLICKGSSYAARACRFCLCTAPFYSYIMCTHGTIP